MLKQYAFIVGGPVVSALVYFLLVSNAVNEQAARMAFVATWVAFWWLTEAVNLGVTALLPFILMPILGIAKTEEVAMQYMDQIIFLFIGGFIIAYAMEKWGLHERLAYRIILLMGNKPSKVLMGVMLTAYFLSMWVSNTATVMMLLAAVLAIIRQKELYREEGRKGAATAILLALSFGATIGGMATPVGTPPNMIFQGFYAREFPDRPQVDFLQWMSFALPFSFTLLGVCFFILRTLFIPRRVDFEFDMAFIRSKYKALGAMRNEEKIVMGIFLVTVTLWFFRETLNLGVVTIPGWSSLFGEYAKNIKDSTVVIFTSLFLFVIPSTANKGEMLIRWKDVERLPLHIILLFGGGFALAYGFETTGLCNLMASQLNSLQNFPVIFILLGMAVLITVLSEFASNTATIQLMLPVMLPLATALGIEPLLLMYTGTLAASLGYMMPVATAANTIVYGSDEVSVKDMMRAGLLLDIAGVILLMIFMATLGKWVFGFPL